jgi:hypothetical protein
METTFGLGVLKTGNNRREISETLLIWKGKTLHSLSTVIQHLAIGDEEIDVWNRSDANEVDEIGSGRTRIYVLAKTMMGFINQPNSGAPSRRIVNPPRERLDTCSWCLKAMGL